MTKIYEQQLTTLKSLKVADYNPRLMPEEEMANLKRALKEFGFVQPIVARKEDGLIIGGHQRVQAYAALLKERGCTQKEIDASPVPVVFVEGFDDAKAKLLNVALNKIHGEWDNDKLSALFGSLTRDAAVELSGFSKDEVDGMLSLATSPALTAAALGNVAHDVEESLGKQTAPTCAECTQLRAENTQLKVKLAALVEEAAEQR
jgi:ParB-like chromosome segregation protein Spo0J